MSKKRGFTWSQYREENTFLQCMYIYVRQAYADQANNFGVYKSDAPLLISFRNYVTGEPVRPGLWLISCYLWNSGMATKYKWAHTIYKWIDNRNKARWAKIRDERIEQREREGA